MGLYATTLDGGNPYTTVVFDWSKPLPLDALPVTRASNGDVITLKASPGDVFNVWRLCPGVLLPFEQSVTLDITNMADFAGNRATTDGQLFFDPFNAAAGSRRRL